MKPNIIHFDKYSRKKESERKELVLKLEVYKLDDTIDYAYTLKKGKVKKSDDFNYQMMTYRGYNQTYQEFVKHLEEGKAFLGIGGIEYDKVEIEECIYDSNVSLDNLWLNTED